MQILVNIILVVNVFVCVALIAVVLLQRSEGGALGMGGGSPSGFMTARGAGDLLTRTTWILAFVFFFLSISLTVLTGKLHGGVGSLVDHINVNSLDLSTPQQKPVLPTPASPATAPPPAVLQAPAPQTQAPAPNNAADSLSILAAPTVQSKVAPAQPKTAPAQSPAQAPEKK
ncbi:MAG: preprotein translocase subunit SecG [Caulobacteraceae bacterium]